MRQFDIVNVNNYGRYQSLCISLTNSVTNSLTFEFPLLSIALNKKEIACPSPRSLKTPGYISSKSIGLKKGLAPAGALLNKP